MNAKEHRTMLFQHLTSVLALSQKKVKNKNLHDNEKQAWCRVLIQAVNAYGRIISTEELEQRVEDLEDKLKNGVLVPNGK